MPNFCHLKYYIKFYFALFRTFQIYATSGILGDICIMWDIYKDFWQCLDVILPLAGLKVSFVYLLIFVSVKGIGMERGCGRCTEK